MKRYINIIAVILMLISSTFATTVYGAELKSLPEGGNTVYETQINLEEETDHTEQQSDGWLKAHVRGLRDHISGHIPKSVGIFGYVANAIVHVSEAGVRAVTIAGGIAVTGSLAISVLSTIGVIIAGIVMLVKKPEKQVVQ